MNNIQKLKERVQHEIRILEKRIDKYDDRIENIEKGNEDKHGKTLEWLDKKSDEAYAELHIWEEVWQYVKNAE